LYRSLVEPRILRGREIKKKQKKKKRVGSRGRKNRGIAK